MIKELQGFDEYITGLMKEWNVPGSAVAVVRNGEAVHSQGYGLRNVEQGLPVTPRTLFAIGSTTKAFTGVAAGILVDQGKLEWDKPIREYLPSFKLFDPVASERLTMRDLLTHRSGLPRHDFVWYPHTPFSRREMVERLQYLEPTCDIRTRYQYQNLMFMTAGYLVEVISGQTWEDFVRQHIFQPLGMTGSHFSVEDARKTAACSLPYDVEQERPVEIPYCDIQAIGPAGTIFSNLEDMTKWVAFQLGQGAGAGQPIISAAALAVTRSPQTIIRKEDLAYDFPEIKYPSYAMGWGVRSYRGHTALMHTGGIDGFIAYVILLPEDNIGVVTFANLDGTDLPIVSAWTALDRLLGLEPLPWAERFKNLKAKEREETNKQKEALVSARHPDTQPSHLLEKYAGEYDHPGYGRLSITLKDGSLLVDRNARQFKLQHYHYDIFELVVKATEKNLPVTFLTGLDGSVGSVSAPMEEGVKDIVFTRVAK